MFWARPRAKVRGGLPPQEDSLFLLSGGEGGPRQAFSPAVACQGSGRSTLAMSATLLNVPVNAAELGAVRRKYVYFQTIGNRHVRYGHFHVVPALENLSLGHRVGL